MSTWALGSVTHQLAILPPVSVLPSGKVSDQSAFDDVELLETASVTSKALPPPVRVPARSTPPSVWLCRPTVKSSMQYSVPAPMQSGISGSVEPHLVVPLSLQDSMVCFHR